MFSLSLSLFQSDSDPFQFSWTSHQFLGHVLLYVQGNGIQGISRATIASKVEKMCLWLSVCRICKYNILKITPLHMLCQPQVADRLGYSLARSLSLGAFFCRYSSKPFKTCQNQSKKNRKVMKDMKVPQIFLGWLHSSISIPS